MVERRTLAEGLETIDPSDRSLEEHFVYGKKTRRTEAAVLPEHSESSAIAAPVEPSSSLMKSHAAFNEKSNLTPLTGVGRVPVGARIRTELAAALKRTSLERQLRGVEPNSVQDILEEALEGWFRANGTLS